MGHIEKLAAVIELILEYHPRGLRVLVGEVEPTTAELNEILGCICSTESEPSARVAAAFPNSPQERSLMRAESILTVVNEAGGWAGIAAMAREFRELYSETGEIFRTHVEWIEAGGGTRKEYDTALMRLATRFDVSVDTVRRKRRFAVEMIASAALRTDRVLTA